MKKYKCLFFYMDKVPFPAAVEKEARCMADAATAVCLDSDFSPALTKCLLCVTDKKEYNEIYEIKINKGKSGKSFSITPKKKMDKEVFDVLVSRTIRSRFKNSKASEIQSSM